jgi:hypothetical protein
LMENLLKQKWYFARHFFYFKTIFCLCNQALISVLNKDLLIHKQWGVGLKPTSCHIGNRSAPEITEAKCCRDYMFRDEV